MTFFGAMVVPLPCVGDAAIEPTVRVQTRWSVFHDHVTSNPALNPTRTDVTGVPTGYVDLDSKTSGLQPGDLIIVAGRPAMGKTSLALNIGEHVAIDKGMPVAVFSMEMGATQLALRMLSSVGRLDQQRLRTGRLFDEDWPKLTKRPPSMKLRSLRLRASSMMRMTAAKALGETSRAIAPTTSASTLAKTISGLYNSPGPNPHAMSAYISLSR